jgi:RNA polymerase sigma-70 factor, ECF subfamily
LDHNAATTLPALLNRLADGDRSACGPAFVLLWPIVRRFTERALGSTADAEDAAQDALVKVFARVSQYDASRSALPWVLSIAAYECKSYRQRRRRSKVTTGGEPDAVDHAPDPERATVERDLEAAVREAVQGLSTSEQFTLRTVLDEQRADALSATVRKQLSRALVRLRIIWRSRHGLD